MRCASSGTLRRTRYQSAGPSVGTHFRRVANHEPATFTNAAGQAASDKEIPTLVTQVTNPLLQTSCSPTKCGNFEGARLQNTEPLLLSREYRRYLPDFEVSTSVISGR
jgi:hypothetical protein